MTPSTALEKALKNAGFRRASLSTLSRTAQGAFRGGKYVAKSTAVLSRIREIAVYSATHYKDLDYLNELPNIQLDI
jgi:hypothetical protein